MTPESENNLRLEIGHVLFIDLVGLFEASDRGAKERLSQFTDIVLRQHRCAMLQTSNSLGAQSRMEWSWCLAIVQRSR